MLGEGEQAELDIRVRGYTPGHTPHAAACSPLQLGGHGDAQRLARRKQTACPSEKHAYHYDYSLLPGRITWSHGGGLKGRIHLRSTVSHQPSCRRSRGRVVLGGLWGTYPWPAAIPQPCNLRYAAPSRAAAGGNRSRWTRRRTC
jgi:hypothetical protein